MLTYEASVIAKDGKHLSCLVTLPDDQGSFPVIVTRTPYDKRQFDSVAMSWAGQGFVFVAQDVRGRYASEGEWLPYAQEEEDGMCTLRWIHTQPWCNGYIAVEGSSYGAFTAYAAAQGDNDGLISALITLVPAMGLRETAFHPSGAFHLWDRIWWDASFGSSTESKQAELMNAIKLQPQLIRHLPVSELPSVFPLPLNNWTRVLDPCTLPETIRLEQVNQAVLHIGGWHDPFIVSLFHNYTTLLQGSKQQTLIVGPWGHEVNADIRFKERNYGKKARIPLGLMELSWLHHTFYGELFPYPHLLLFVMGANEWICPPQWPIPDTKAIKLYLTHPDSSPSRCLVDNCPKLEEPDHYFYDPDHPFPSREYPVSRQDLETRVDVLCFTSPPLEMDILVMGSPVAELWVSSTAASTDFYVCLSDVDTYDASIYVTHGYTTIHPNGSDSIDLHKLTLEMKPICQLFAKGTRIRLSISSSCFPEYARHLNLPGDSLQETEQQTAKQVVWHDSRFPSFLVLPAHNEALERWSYAFSSHV